MPLIKPLKRVDAAYQGFKVVKYWLGISRKSYLFSCCYLFRKTFFIGFNEDLKCFSIPDLRTRIFFFRNKPWFLFHQTMLRNFVFDLFNTYSKWLNEEKKILFSILTPVDTGNFYINIKFIFLWIWGIYVQLDGVL